MMLEGKKMKIPDEIIALNPDDLKLNDEAKAIVHLLLNTIEQTAQTIQELQRENQKLKDEVNRLKGEKGKPKILPNVPKKENNKSKPRKRSKKWKKKSKKDRIKIDRTEHRNVDSSRISPLRELSFHH